MSSFEQYDEVAAFYDDTRRPVGTDIIRDVIHARVGADTRLLDAGCGTGAYAEALAPHMSVVNAVDLSWGMLSRARLRPTLAKACFTRAGLLDLPFADGTFDAVMINQVLHHLETGDDPSYAMHGSALAELGRVLRPGGVLVANLCDHDQLRDGFWPYGLAPRALTAVLSRCCPVSTVETMLRALGMRDIERHVPLDGMLQGEYFRDPRGPFDPNWRRADSFWSLTSPAELEAVLAELRALDDDGRLEDFVGERDRKRHAVGQATFIAATRG